MIEKLNTRWCVRGVLRAARQIGPWIAATLFLVVAVGQADSAALAGLFQSPPTETPTPEAEPTLTPTIEAAPTLTPTIEVTPTLTPTLEPTLTPTITPLPTELPDLAPSPMVEPVETPAITATMPISVGSEELGSVGVRNRYPDEESKLEFEWGMLFDSMALGVSYAWLCCGVGLMILLPIFFLALWVAARRRRRRME